tara:strand:+ start:442 stop:954 length:513 start_codon:yes stop_codon:yes gene_type:complete
MTSKYRIPAPLQNTIDNLAFLAGTQEGEKLYFKEKIHITDSSWLARAKRWYNSESLETQKKIIKEIVDLGLDSIKTYEKNTHYPRLIREFWRAKEGLHNLRNTYFKQGREVTDLDTQLYIMQNQLLGLSKETKKKAGIEVTPPDYEPNAAMVERDPTETNDNNIDDVDFT